MPKPLDYRPPPRPATTATQVVVLVALAAAVVQLLAVQLSPDAPARRGTAAATGQAAGRAAVLAPVVRLAAGRNVELHFVENPPSPQTGMATTGIYYGLNYALWPARAYVGRDDRVNDDQTLRAADAVPPDAWMAAHGVAAVVTFPVAPDGIGPPRGRGVR